MPTAIYLDVPFCQHICNFCVYPTLLDARNRKDYYLNELLPRNIIENKEKFNQFEKFDELYIGGGTPTIANEKQLQNLVDLLPINIDKKCLESSITTLGDKHVEFLIKNNFCYLSIGVQTLDKQTLKMHNRPAVGLDRLKDIIKALSDHNIVVNLDIIVGLSNDLNVHINDLNNIIDDIRPHSVCVHFNYKMDKIKKFEFRQQVVNHFLNYDTDYICVNNDFNDLEYDNIHDSEYRLMNKNFDFTFRQIGSEPCFPQYPWTILSFSGIDGFVLYEGEQTEQHVNCYQRLKDVRQKINLPIF